MRKFDPKSFGLDGLQAVQAWLKRCTDRQAYREAMRKGDGEGGVDWRECVVSSFLIFSGRSIESLSGVEREGAVMMCVVGFWN